MTSSISTNIVNLLGTGSGVDVKTLAQNLVEAEKAPRQAIIDKTVKASQARISGYSSVMQAMAGLRDAFAALQDKSAVSAATVANSLPGALVATADATAIGGTHDYTVNALASAQRSLSGGFDSADMPLNAGTISITPGTSGTAIPINVQVNTPNGIAAAINAQTGSTGVSARVVNTGIGTQPYKIVLDSSRTGAANAFAVNVTGFSSVASASDGTPLSTLAFPTELQPAADARLTVDGVEIHRAGNTITDAIAGVTLQLRTAGGTSGVLDIARDTAGVKNRLNTLVAAFNQAREVLNAVSDAKSADPYLGATLVNDSLVRTLKGEIANVAISLSASPGTDVKALRDLGITLQRNGTLGIDQARLDTALSTRMDQVVQMLTAGADNSTAPGSGSRGLAGDIAKRLGDLVAGSGPIVAASKQASDRITRESVDQAKLEADMQTLLERYTRQFAVMDRLVGQLNSLKTSLKSQFEAMSNARNN